MLERRTDSSDDCAVIVVNRDPRRPREITSEMIVKGPETCLPATAPMVEAVSGCGCCTPSRRRPPSGRPLCIPLWRPEAQIAIEDVYPRLDGGRYPVKRIVGELFEVWADLFRDGHDKLRAVVKYRIEDGLWRETPLGVL